MSTLEQPLNGKLALVTGGSRGLGRAMVERLARDGAEVVFSYRSNREAAEAVLAMGKKAGATMHACQADLSSLDGVRALFGALDAILQKRDEPRFDILVCNAGIIHQGGILEVDEAAFDAIFDLNVKGLFFTIKEAVSRLRDGGRVINLGTGLTRIVMPEYVTYSAAKCAVEGLTASLAKQLGKRKITVNVVAPGAIDTDMNPWLKTADGIQQMSSMTALDRVGHAEDIADVVAFLASDDSRWVTGQRIEASGGQSL